MRVEQEHVAKMVHVTDVAPGDLIDTEGWWTPEAWDVYSYDSDDELASAQNVAQFELGEVNEIEIDSDDVVTIHFVNLPSFGWPTNKPIVVQRRLNR
jgi:hypothetical protein